MESVVLHRLLVNLLIGTLLLMVHADQDKLDSTLASSNSDDVIPPTSSLDINTNNRSIITNAAPTMHYYGLTTHNVTALVNATWNETDLTTFNKSDSIDIYGGVSDNSTMTVSTDELVAKILEGYKNLLSKPYWQERMRDPYFLGEMLVPFTAGIAVSWLLVLFVCTVKICCCSATRRKLRKGRKIRKIKSDQKNKDGPQWTLLERNSSDEEI